MAFIIGNLFGTSQSFWPDDSPVDSEPQWSEPQWSEPQWSEPQWSLPHRPDLVTQLLSESLHFTMPWLDHLLDPTRSDAEAATEPTSLGLLFPAQYMQYVQAISGENCCVCLELQAGSPCARLECTHQFHRHCVDKWLRTKASCPVCRWEPAGAPHAVTPLADD